MKRSEIYSGLRAMGPCFVRLDGRNFKRTLDILEFEKPYDVRLRDGFVNAALRLFKDGGFNPVFLYTFSDEVSIFFNDLPFDGRVEKLDSVLASFFSSALTIELGTELPLAFDSRVVPVHPGDVVDYLQWRQAESFRNCLNSYSYYTLRKSGAGHVAANDGNAVAKGAGCIGNDDDNVGDGSDISGGSVEHIGASSGVNGREAARIMNGMKASDMHELLFSHGININNVDAWQRRGVLVYNEEYTKEGFNPVAGERVMTSRRRVVVDMDLPLFSSSAGQVLLERLHIR